MTGYTFVASSKELALPDEIAAYNRAGIFNEEGKYFNVWPLSEQETGERRILETILTMPYIYYIAGIGNSDFWLYIDHYMETGDVLEIINIHSINDIEKIIDTMLAEPYPIFINVGSEIFQNPTGTYKLKKDWIDDLNHRTLVTNFGVTTIVKYGRSETC